MTRVYILLIIITTLLNINTLKSQEIVFNEYTREYLNTPASIEMLVVEDYLDLRGYYIRDSHNDVWNAGIRFKDNSLWKNIKSGTCIIIDLTSKAIPLKEDDFKNGIIRVSISDDKYFDYTDSTLNDDLSKKGSISMEEDNNILQILDNGKNSVHIAAHGTNSSKLYSSLNQPKLLLNEVLSYGLSWTVFPGRDIEYYNSVYKKNVISSNTFTIGKANTIILSSGSNADFWHQLRKPKYGKLNLSITHNNTKSTLIWDKINIEDNYNNHYGYLILYGLKSEVQNSLNDSPSDGFNYQKGEYVKKWKVLDNIVGANNNYYDLAEPFEPNDYLIKVVPYAFITTKEDESAFGLGSAYQDKKENVVSLSIKSTLTKVLMIDNIKYIVNGQSVSLYYNYNTYHNTEWYKSTNPDSAISFSKNTLSVSEPGKYYALMYYNKKLIGYTDTVEVKELNLSIKLDNNVINSDTICYRCNNFINNLSVELENYDFEVSWFKNSKKISDQNSININSIGNYFCILVYKNITQWQSYTISIREKQVILVPSENNIILPNNSRIIFWLENKSNDDILVEKSDFQLAEPFQFNIETKLPTVLQKNQKLQCEIKYFNKAPKKDTTYGHLYYVNTCGNTVEYLIKGYNNITEPKIILSSQAVKFGHLRNCKFDTLSIEYGLQGLEGSILYLTNPTSSNFKAEFENGKNYIHVDNISDNKIHIFTTNQNLPDGNYKAKIEISAVKDTYPLFVDTISVYASIVSNPFIISTLNDKVFYCNKEEYQYIPVLISNNSFDTLRFSFPDLDSMDCSCHRLDLVEQKDTVIYFGFKYSEYGKREIKILEENCNTLISEKVYTEMIELKHDAEINIDISEIYTNEAQFELNLEVFPIDLLNFISYLCPKHIKYLDSKLDGNLVTSNFVVDISKVKNLKDSIFIGNAYCQEEHVILIKYQNDSKRISQCNELHFSGKPLENIEKEISFKLPNQNHDFTINKITIDSDRFKISENIPIPINLADNSKIKISYSNLFALDTATLILHYSKPFEFVEKIILYGAIEDNFKPETDLHTDSKINIDSFEPKKISGTIKFDNGYTDYLDTLFLKVKYNQDSYSFKAGSFKLKTAIIDQNIQEEEGYISCIFVINNNNKDSIINFEFFIQAKNTIINEIDSLKISTYFTVKNIESVKEEKTTIIDATELFEKNKTASLNGKWVSVSGRNPIYGVASYEVRSSIDAELDIYLINDLGEKYFLNVNRQQNIYYFNVDVRDIPLGVYTIIIKAQSKLFSKRILLIE